MHRTSRHFLRTSGFYTQPLVFKRGIQDFHMNYVLVPADKAANNVVVV